MMQLLTTGKIVSVYHDPFCQKQYEGVARLERFVSREEETGLETWHVRFIHTGHRACRRIHPVEKRRLT